MKLPKGIDRTPEKQKLFMDVLVEGWTDRQRRIFLKDGWIDRGGWGSFMEAASDLLRFPS